MSEPLLHPRAVTLSRYADGTLDAGERARVAEHLARCAACRADAAAMRDVAARAARVASADLPPDVLARVLASRESGVRAVLMVPGDAGGAGGATALERHGRVWWIVAASVLMAVAATIAVTATGRRPPIDDTEAPVSIASTFALAPSVAHAQEAPPARPAVPPAAGLDGTHLQPMTLEYERRETVGGAPRPGGRGTLSLAAAYIDGQAAWRSAQIWRTGDGVIESETLYVARADLRPLGRTIHVRPYLRYREITIRQRFVGDSVLGWMHTNETLGRPIARRLPRAFAPYTTDAFSPLFLAGVPLRAGWSGSVSLLGWAVRPNDLLVSIALRVTGEERVVVPGGTFDCWAMTLETRGATIRYWARKSDGVGVRVLQSSGDRTYELVLANPFGAGR